MIKRIFQISSQSIPASSVLLILRLAVGIAFMYHGWGKIQNPFGWVPPEAPMQIPAVFQFLAAFSEFGGGIALVLGLLTPLNAFGMGITMSVAVYLHMIVLKDPYVNQKGGGSYELALIYLCIAILFFVVGPGKYSMDSIIFGERRQQ